jgi:hypothetical protein
MAAVERWWILSPNTSGVIAVQDEATAERARAVEPVVGPLVPETTHRGAVDLLRDVATAGVEFDDARLGYVSVQIDRATWDAIAHFKEQTPDRAG